MPFELSLSSPLPTTLRRIAAERLDESLSSLDRALSDQSVHTARKRLKELRALLRLLRGPLPRATFRRENTTLRDAARPLSDLRDAAVMLETLDTLLDHFSDDTDPKSFTPLRTALESRHRTALKQARDNQAVPHLRTTLTATLTRLPHWPLPPDDDDSATDFSLLRPGLKRTYRQGRRAMKTALADPTDDHLHEWRKRSKDLRYQLELLTPLHAPKLKPLAEKAKDLTDALGLDHDLAVLQSLLNTTYHNTLPKDLLSTLESLLLKRRHTLQKNAASLGHSLYSDKPKPFTRRIKSYWNSAH